MRNRQATIAGLAVAAVLGLSGCTGGGDKPQAPGGPATAPSTAGRTASTAVATDAKGALTAAAARLGEESMKVSQDMSGALSMSGVMDPRAGTARMSLELGAGGAAGVFELIKINNDLYLRGKLVDGDGTKPWKHVDAAKLARGSTFDIMPADDPTGAAALVAATTAVERSGERGFTGTLDLTKAPRYSQGNLKQLGAKATKVPFTAATDAQGRLTELTLDLAGLGPGVGKIKSTFSDFGTPVAVEPPPSTQIGELPADLSGLLTA